MWKKSIAEFGEEVSIAGSQIACNKKVHVVRRLIWSLFIMVGLAVTFYLVSERVKYYLSSPVAVDLRLGDVEELPFPSVTVCGASKYRKEWLDDRNLTDDFVRFMATLRRWYHKLRHNASLGIGDIPAQERNLRFPLADGLDYQAAMDKARHLREDHCTYSFTKCRPDDVDYVQLEQMGGCVTYNPTQQWMAKSTGLSSALFLRNLQVGGHSQLTGMFFTGNGLEISVHNAHERPTPLDEGIRIGPATKTKLNLRATKFTFQEKLSGCISEPLAAAGSATARYSQMKCLYECRLQYVLAKCGCAEWNVRKAECVTVADQLCSVIADASFWGDNSKAALVKGCGCPQECEIIRYDVTSSSYGFASTTEDAVDTSQPENFAVVNVFFGNSYYEHIIQQEAYTIWSMISDMGGALGLFLGSALYTVLELIDFVVANVIGGLIVGRSQVTKINV